jgi:NTP pyrophosphatase (non-canonical NTP hydrolase)/deoxyadenosine/deoxycytidine kinase
MLTKSSSSTLAELQRFQRRFDAACGFDATANSADFLGGLEFTALALSGEVGEVANLLKKMRRASWRDETVEVERDELAAELGDVLAYAMKLANQLDIDLAGAYQEKMRGNWERFGVMPRVVTVMGAPGAGKTTVARMLASRFPAYVEHADANPHLGGQTWPDPASALSSQQWFLTQIADTVMSAARGEPLVVDQDPRAVVRVYSTLMVREGRLCSSDVDQLAQALGPVEDALRNWSAGWWVVLLDAEPDVLAHRVEHRDGAGSVVLEHIAQLRDAFARFAADLPGLSIVDTEGLKPAEVADAVEQQLCATA